MAESSHVTQQALTALNEAALAIAAEVSLEKVLQQITDSARSLVGARYAALGVPDAAGHLGRFVSSGLAGEEEKEIPHKPKGLGLLGAILQEGRTIRLPHIVTDPRSVGFPSGHPHMASFLGVPIKAGNEVLGNLYLADKLSPASTGEREEVGEFTATDQRLLEMFAAHAAIAIQNARLYEQVGRLAIVEERSRLGMDLHDGVIQSIYAVGLTLESARMMLPDEPEEANVIVTQAIAGLNDAIRDIRNFILDLRPERLTGDLNQTLARLVREFQANAMVPVELTAETTVLSELPVPVSRTILLTTQEALANVARHARADQVTVSIRQENECALLTVTDDGQGFSVEEQTQSVGHGLANMRARAEELDGIFTVESAPGSGTTIRLELPLSSSTE